MPDAFGSEACACVSLTCPPTHTQTEVLFLLPFVSLGVLAVPCLSRSVCFLHGRDGAHSMTARPTGAQGAHQI